MSCSRSQGHLWQSWELYPRLLTLCLSPNSFFSSMHYVSCITCIATSPWQTYEQQHDVMSVDASMWLLIQSNLWKHMLEFEELNKLKRPPKKYMPFNRSFKCIQSTLLYMPKFQGCHSFCIFEPSHFCSQGMCWPKYRNVKFFHPLFFSLGYSCVR